MSLSKQFMLNIALAKPPLGPRLAANIYSQGKTHTKPLRTGSVTPPHIQVHLGFLNTITAIILSQGQMTQSEQKAVRYIFNSVKCIFNQLSRFSAFAAATTLNLDFHASRDCVRNETQIKTWGSFTEIYIPVVSLRKERSAE